MFLKNKYGNTVNTSDIVAGSVHRAINAIWLYTSPDDEVVFQFDSRDKFDAALKRLEEILMVEHIRWIAVGNYQFRADKVSGECLFGEKMRIKTHAGAFDILTDSNKEAQKLQEQFNKSLKESYFLEELI